MDDSFAARVDRLLAEVALDTDISLARGIDFTPTESRPFEDPPAPEGSQELPQGPSSAGLSTNPYTPADDTPAQHAHTTYAALYPRHTALQAPAQEETTHVIQATGGALSPGSEPGMDIDTESRPVSEQLRWSNGGCDDAFSFEFADPVGALREQKLRNGGSASASAEGLTTDEQVIKLLNNLEQEVDLASRSRTPKKYPVASEVELTSWQGDNLSPRDSSAGRRRPVSAPPKKPGNFRQHSAPRAETRTPGRSTSASRPGQAGPRAAYSPPVLPTATRRRSPGRTGAGASPTRAAKNRTPLAEELAAGRTAGKKKPGNDTSKLQATIQAQELRLKGQTETIRALERTAKAKDTALKLLEEEMKSRSEAVHSAQAAAIMASATAKRLGDETSKSAALMAARKRSDELSARCSQLESQVKDLKKAEKLARERGNSLVVKLKESEDLRCRLAEELSRRKKVGAAAAATIKTLHKQIKAMERDAAEKQQMAERMMQLRKELSEMQAVKKANKELQEENDFVKTEVSRLSAACHQSESHAQEAEKNLAEIRLELSDCKARVAEANDNVRLVNEEKSKMERHSRVMESTCERLRDQLREHTERARKELSDARWQKAKETARKATRTVAERSVLASDSDDERLGPLPHRPLSVSRDRATGSVESLGRFEWREESPASVAVGSEPELSAMQGGLDEDVPEGHLGPSGQESPEGPAGQGSETALTFRVPHTTDGTGPRSETAGDSFMLSQASSPSALLESVREQMARRSPRQSPGEDLPGSASRRLAELRARYSKLKDKLNQ